jgi:non-homologous end joining protein Ku
MACPYWSGQVKILSPSFGVNLYVATEAKSNIAFIRSAEVQGSGICHQKVLSSDMDRQSTEPGDAVEKDEIVKAHEYSKGQDAIPERVLCSLRWGQGWIRCTNESYVRDRTLAEN